MAEKSDTSKTKKRLINYIQTNNRIKSINEQIKQLRTKLKPYEERKKKLTPHIIDYINRTNKQNTKSKTFNFHNYKLTAFTSKRTQSISKDYLTHSITKYYKGDKQKAEHLVNFIYNNRDITTTQQLRQTEKKT